MSLQHFRAVGKTAPTTRTKSPREAGSVDHGGSSLLRAARRAVLAHAACHPHRGGIFRGDFALLTLGVGEDPAVELDDCLEGSDCIGRQRRAQRHHERRAFGGEARRLPTSPTAIACSICFVNCLIWSIDGLTGSSSCSYLRLSHPCTPTACPGCWRHRRVASGSSSCCSSPPSAN